MSDRANTSRAIDIEIALNRQKVVDALLSGEHHQLFGAVGDFRNPEARVCFIGLLCRLWPSHGGIRHLQDKLGIDINTYIRDNDNGASFADLAARLKAEPPVYNT